MSSVWPSAGQLPFLLYYWSCPVCWGRLDPCPYKPRFWGHTFHSILSIFKSRNEHGATYKTEPFNEIEMHAPPKGHGKSVKCSVLWAGLIQAVTHSGWPPPGHDSYVTHAIKQLTSHLSMQFWCVLGEVSGIGGIIPTYYTKFKSKIFENIKCQPPLYARAGRAIK